MQTLIFNTANAGTNNDTDTITGTTGNDQLTVAELPTTAGSGATVSGMALLPNGAVAGSSVTAFLNGAPYLNSPPETIANSRPGIAGGSSGPDLLINGIASTLTLDGGGSTGAANTGDQAIVYGASENALVDVGNGTDIFGLGAGVLQAEVRPWQWPTTPSTSMTGSPAPMRWPAHRRPGHGRPQRPDFYAGRAGLCRPAAGPHRRWRRRGDAGQPSVPAGRHCRQLLREPVQQLQHPDQRQLAEPDHCRRRAAGRSAQRELPRLHRRFQRQRFSAERDPHRPKLHRRQSVRRQVQFDRARQPRAGQRHRQHHWRQQHARRQSERLLQGPRRS